MEGESWLDKKEKEILTQIHKDFTIAILWGNFPPREPKEDDSIKLAWVEVAKRRRRVMIGVDNKTMKGYALHENRPEIKLPLEEVFYDKFERWCTSFDV